MTTSPTTTTLSPLDSNWERTWRLAVFRGWENTHCTLLLERDSITREKRASERVWFHRRLNTRSSLHTSPFFSSTIIGSTEEMRRMLKWMWDLSISIRSSYLWEASGQRCYSIPGSPITHSISKANPQNVYLLRKPFISSSLFSVSFFLSITTSIIQ